MAPLTEGAGTTPPPVQISPLPLQGRSQVVLLSHLGCFNYYFLDTQHVGILVPRLGIEPKPPALETQSPNHCTAKEVPSRGA